MFVTIFLLFCFYYKRVLIATNIWLIYSCVQSRRDYISFIQKRPCRGHGDPRVRIYRYILILLLLLCHYEANETSDSARESFRRIRS